MHTEDCMYNLHKATAEVQYHILIPKYCGQFHTTSINDYKGLKRNNLTRELAKPKRSRANCVDRY